LKNFHVCQQLFCSPQHLKKRRAALDICPAPMQDLMELCSDKFDEHVISKSELDIPNWKSGLVRTELNN